MANQLTTGTSSGTQTGKQNLQAPAGYGTTNTASSGSVQPGTASNLLNSDKGSVPLQSTPLSIVSLGTRQSQVSQFTPPPARHVNPFLFGVSGLLFLVAVALFVATARAAKNTTE